MSCSTEPRKLQTLQWCYTHTHTRVIYLSTIRLYILQAPQEVPDHFRPRAWWGIALGTQAERSGAERSDTRPGRLSPAGCGERGGS